MVKGRIYFAVGTQLYSLISFIVCHCIKIQNRMTFLQEISLLLPFSFWQCFLLSSNIRTLLSLSLSPGSLDWSLEMHLSLPDIVSYCYSAPVSLHMTKYSGPNETVLYPLWLILWSSANAVRMLVCRRAICFSGNELWEQLEVSQSRRKQTLSRTNV